MRTPLRSPPFILRFVILTFSLVSTLSYAGSPNPPSPASTGVLSCKPGQMWFGSCVHLLAQPPTGDACSATNTVNSGTITLQSGSPAIGAGANLHSPCNVIRGMGLAAVVH
jgi:X-X-X-Leu-X-X-Gly heptad repeat protein